MEQHEKELLEKLRQQTEEMEIPDSLRPEKMEQQLKKRKVQKRRGVYAYVLVAASCAAILGLAMLVGGMRMKKTEKEKPIAQNVSTKIEKVAVAKTYEDIFPYIKQEEEKYEMEDAKGNMMEAVKEDYSQTNTRDAKVGEADIVKTDGRYIYTVTEEMKDIGIVDTQGGRMKQVANLLVDGCEYIHEIYVQDDRLIVLYVEAYQGMMAGDQKYFVAKDTVKTALYDISDPADPKRINVFSQSGGYETSRVNGDYLYVFSQYYLHGRCKVNQYENYIPCVQDELIAADKIVLPENKEDASMYMIVTSVDIKNPTDITDTMAVLMGPGQHYVSPENIYTFERIYNNSVETKTAIRKITYKDGEMAGKGKTEIFGYLNDSFSIDEYKGYLRMVVSLEQADTNSVYVLDENLKMTGKILGLAKDERVYSARFMGDIAYFVTFRETDPLFSVDLSDPANPKIIGELKIPGFSEYLHPYGDGLLLGIGKEISADGTRAEQVKLSMFDVSDPYHVKEVDQCIVKGAYESPACYNYKSVTIDAEKNIIGFSAYAENNKYYVYAYNKEKGFTCALKEVLSNGYPEARGIYIKEVFYLVKGKNIEAYNLQNFEKIDEIILFGTTTYCDVVY